jgi:hypothetical protein
VRKTAKNLEGMNENSTDIWKDTIVQKYENRPNDLENVNLADFVSKYYKANDRKYKLRAIPKIIRSTHYELSDLSNFKREMVLLFVPFKNEELDILDNNAFLKIYEDNEALILQRRKEYESNIDIQKTMEICKQMCIELDEESESREKLEEYRRSQLVHDDFLTENTDDIQVACMEKMSSVVRKRENVMSSAEYCEAMRLTNKEQREIILEAIHRMVNRNITEPLQIFFTGPAGCGKTFTLKLLMETYNRFSLQHNSIYNAYVSCASTGKAAVAIHGTTVHSAFKITLSRVENYLNIETLNAYRNSFRNVCAIFVDEVSMIGAELLQIVNSRLQQITMQFDKPFGGMDIIFCGDLRQLPPVMATPIYRRLKTSINGEILWHSLKFYPLTQVMRQKDQMFSSILTKIGDGEKLTDVEVQTIESRFVDKDEAIQKHPDAVRLFLRNASVKDYNNKALHNERTIEVIAEDIYCGYKNNEQLVSMRTKLHKMTVTETNGLPYMLKVLLNKSYMITTNIDVVDGLANGAIGTLKCIELDEDDTTVKHLWLDFNNDKIGRLMKLKCLPYVVSNKLNRRWVPIAKRSSSITFKSRMLKCKRIQFPLVEACALTIHKSQGGTFTEVVYDYEKSHEQQLVYVALSRVTSLNGLHLTNPNDDFTFHHGCGKLNKELKTEFQRLQKHRLSTVSEHCRMFLDKTIDLKLLTLNVQNLKAHKEDLETDYVLTQSNIMALSETWLDNGESLNLNGYRCITQFKREDVRAGGVAIYEKENCTLYSTPHILMKFDHNDLLQVHSTTAGSQDCGDICVIETIVNDQKVLLVTVYITPSTNMKDVKFFFLRNLLMYTPKASSMFQEIKERGYDKIPIILSGDFNIDLKKQENQSFVDFMEDSFGLELNSNANISTTRESSCLDAVFTRNLHNIDTTHYITYFSYHKSLLTTSESF